MKNEHIEGIGQCTIESLRMNWNSIGDGMDTYLPVFVPCNHPIAVGVFCLGPQPESCLANLGWGETSDIFASLSEHSS